MTHPNVGKPMARDGSVRCPVCLGPTAALGLIEGSAVDFIAVDCRLCRDYAFPVHLARDLAALPNDRRATLMARLQCALLPTDALDVVWLSPAILEALGDSETPTD